MLVGQGFYLSDTVSKGELDLSSSTQPWIGFSFLHSTPPYHLPYKEHICTSIHRWAFYTV